MKTLRLLPPLAALGLLAAACSAPLYLEKQTVAAPKHASLEGKRIFLPPIEDVSDPNAVWKESTPAELEYKYAEPSAEKRNERLTRRDQAAAAAAAAGTELEKLGWHRNLYGMPIRDVTTLTPPATWLREAIAAELEAQGAEVVETPDNAHLVVRGTLRWMRVELFDTKKLWADLVLDVRIGKPGEEPEPQRLHTRGKATAWTGGEPESFEALTRAEQQLEILLFAALDARLVSDCACRCP